MKISNARGSRLLMTSFGMPLVTIVAACDVRLLVIWLYASPIQSVIGSKRDLDVVRTIQGIPGKHGACLETTTNLFHPFVVESHPWGPLALWDVAWLSRLPEVVGLEVLVESDRIWGPSAPCSISPKPDGLAEHRTLRGGSTVPVATDEKNDGTKKEDYGRECKSKIVAIILYGY